MRTKLTLSIDPMLIKQAKLYAKERGKTVSQIVSDYFSLLNLNDELREAFLPPLTRSLRGIMKNLDIAEKGYKKYLEDKFL